MDAVGDYQSKLETHTTTHGIDCDKTQQGTRVRLWACGQLEPPSCPLQMSPQSSPLKDLANPEAAMKRVQSKEYDPREALTPTNTKLLELENLAIASHWPYQEWPLRPTCLFC